MKNLVLIILAAIAGGLAVFAYFQDQSLRQQTELIQKLSSRLETPSGGATLALQEKCAKQAREEFNNLGWAKEPLASFTNHYNEKMKRCFVVIANFACLETAVWGARA